MDRLDSQALLALQRGLTGERVLAGSGYMDDPALLAAYDDYYSHVSTAQIRRICLLTGLRPSSVLDMGAGPGSVSIAFAELGSGAFTLVDSSAAALDRAVKAIAAKRGAAALSVKTVIADLESPAAVPPGPFDSAVFGHCLNEIGRGDDRIERRLTILRRVASALAPAGSVLILEPATLASSRDALLLRDRLVAEGWRVLAPCFYSGPCPALTAGANHTCHDEAAWNVPPAVRRLAETVGLDRDLIKMSWLLVVPPLVVPPLVVPPSDDRRDSTGIGLPRAGSSDTGDLYRVVSAPMLNKGGRVRYLLCGRKGRFPFSAKKDDPDAARAGFFAMNRYDVVRVEKPEIREGGWGFIAGTRISLVDSLVFTADRGIE